MATVEPKYPTTQIFQDSDNPPQDCHLTTDQQTLLLQQQESQFQRNLGFSENYSAKDISSWPKKLQRKEKKKQYENFLKKIQYESGQHQENYDSPRLKRAIKTGKLYDFLNYCRFKYTASPQLHRHLFLYENCQKWHTTKKGKKISGHYFSCTCPACKILGYKRLPCGSAVCPECSEHLRNRRFHKILPLLADNEHAYLMIRLPEKLKNLEKFNYKNSRNLNELYLLIEKSLKEYAQLKIKENNYQELNLGFYVGLHTYSTSTILWDLHFNILLSLLTFYIKPEIQEHYKWKSFFNDNCFKYKSDKKIVGLKIRYPKKILDHYKWKSFFQETASNFCCKFPKEIIYHNFYKSFFKNPASFHYKDPKKFVKIKFYSPLQEIIKDILKKYRNSKDYKIDFERKKKRTFRETGKYVNHKKIKIRIEVEHLKFNLPQSFSKFEIKYIDYQKLREIINKNIEQEYGQEFTDKNLYIRDAYSKDNFSGDITRKSPEHTAGLMSSYLNNIPVYDKNILKITKDKITIKLKDTLKSNEKGKTIYHQFTLPHLNFFNRYQQHLLYVNYANPEATNKKRISTFRNLRGYGYYSNNSLLSLAYKKVEKEPEKLICDNCAAELSQENIGLIVFNGVVIYFSKSILQLGLRLFLKNGIISNAELEFLIIRMSKPPPFLIPTTQPLFPGENKEKNRASSKQKSSVEILILKMEEEALDKILLQYPDQVCFECGLKVDARDYNSKLKCCDYCKQLQSYEFKKSIELKNKLPGMAMMHRKDYESRRTDFILNRAGIKIPRDLENLPPKHEIESPEYFKNRLLPEGVNSKAQLLKEMGYKEKC